MSEAGYGEECQANRTAAANECGAQREHEEETGDEIGPNTTAHGDFGKQHGDDRVDEAHFDHAASNAD